LSGKPSLYEVWEDGWDILLPKKTISNPNSQQMQRLSLCGTAFTANQATLGDNELLVCKRTQCYASL